MNWLPEFRFSHRKDELQEELESHLKMAIQDRVERGEPENEARHAVLREFGNVALIGDVTRQTWGWAWFEHIAQDFGFALRQLRKTPGFAIASVLTLALGIGANIAIFSLIYSAMLRRLPVPHPEELVSLHADLGEKLGGDQPGQGFEAYQRNGMYKALSGQSALAGLCGQIGASVTDATGDEPVHLGGEAVTGDCFTTLGIKPLLGRLILPADDTPNPGPQGFAAVISYGWWTARYHRDPSVVGKRLIVTGMFSEQVPIVIVGVLPPEFHGLTAGRDPRIYVPAYFFGPQNRDVNSNISMLLFGRLKPKESLSRSEAQLQPLFQDWLRKSKLEEVKSPSLARLVLRPDAAGYSALAGEYGKGLRLLQALVSLILVAGCFYLSTLSSARAVARRKEFAVRAALGASRSRLISQSMIESAILVGSGTIAGVFIAWASARYLVRFLSHGSDSLFLDVRPQGWVLGFAVGVAFIALLVTGLLPAWRATKTNVIADIKESRTGALAGVRQGFGSLLFPLQIALSLVVIVVSSLLSASLLRALTQDNGFSLDKGVFVSTDVPMVLPEQDKDGKKLQSSLAMYNDILDRLNHTPGIASASADVTHPLGGAFYGTSVASRYRDAPRDDSQISFLIDWIAPRYFETAGTRMIAGRDFDQFDRRGSLPVCILSESAARYLFPNMSPIGQTTIQTFEHRSYDVVGVVQDTRFRGIESHAPMMMYLPISQTEGFLNSVEFFMRTDDIETAVAALRRILHERAGAHVMEVTPVTEAVKESLSRTRLLTLLSNTLAGLALLLSAVGIFGLLNYSVSRRTTEIGVRMALGASRGRVIAMTLRQATLLILPGIALGFIASWLASRLIASLLYQTKHFDPAAFTVSFAALAVVVGIASYLPARRAARVEPMAALRAE